MKKYRIYKRYKTRKRGGQHYTVGGKKSKYARGPKPKTLRKVKIFKTIAIQDSKTGLMEGRKRSNVSDRVGILIDPATGRIFGRFPKSKKYKK